MEHPGGVAPQSELDGLGVQLSVRAPHENLQGLRRRRIGIELGTSPIHFAAPNGAAGDLQPDGIENDERAELDSNSEGENFRNGRSTLVENKGSSSQQRRNERGQQNSATYGFHGHRLALRRFVI